MGWQKGGNAMLRALGLGLFFVFAAGAANTTAAETVLGGVSITLPVPDGFCELSAGNSADNRIITAISGVVATGGNKLLSMSADCQELADWRVGKRNFLDDYGQYQTRAAQMDRLVPSAQAAVSETCAGMRTVGKQIVSSISPDAKSIIENALKNIKFNSVSFAGVLAEDQTACYAAEVESLKTEAGTEKIQLILIGVTVVKGKFLFVYRFSVYDPSADVKARLAKLQSTVASLQAANK
jgi:hypothetical protein